MSEAQLIQSFLPLALSEEITRRYTVGTATLTQLIGHFSQRVQLQDALANTIEKAAAGAHGKLGTIKGSGGGSGFGSLSGSSSSSSSTRHTDEEIDGLLAALQKEVEGQMRMHLHLGERINNEVVRPLSSFMTKDAWLVAKDIEAKVRHLATTMRSHHEQIPKLSARTVSKSAKTSQQAKQKLDDESRALVQLQQRWQAEIAAMVDDFETADVARIELIRESVLRFEHYRGELHKAAQGGTAAAREIAKGMQPHVRIIDAMQGDAGRSGARPAAAGSEETEEAGGRGLFKRGLFRGKTRRASKTASAEQSTASLHSRSVSSMASPGNAPAVPPSIQTATTRDTADSEVFSPGLSSDGQSIPASRLRGDSLVSSQESHVEGTAEAREPAGERAAPAGTQGSGGDFAEWVFAEGSQEAGAVDASVGSLVHVAAGGLPPISEDRKEEEPAAEDTSLFKDVKVDDVKFGDVKFDDVKFDDVFGAPSGPFETQTAEANSADSSGAPATAIDLDSVFSIPNEAAKPADAATPKPSTPSPHQRSASLDNGRTSGTSSSAEDSDAEAADQSFRVKFSIRDRAIEDNPDESKAALSRVTTLLRAAPASRGGNRRRDVRTMYVPSSLPITGGFGLDADAPVETPTDSSVRRRARPPPPPPAPAGSRARSIRQQSQASLATATADAAVPSAAEPEATAGDGEARAVPRGRRQASSGPVAIAMHVIETLDFNFRHPADDSDIEFTSLVTGSISMRIAQAINPLELAPLRISVQDIAGVQLVANPAVVVADSSLTGGLNDGRTWYRFVRPNLFAQGGADVAVFKYQVAGSDQRVMPMHVHQGNVCSAGSAAIMLFCDPHASGAFGGDTLVGPAVLLNIEGGSIKTQSSRPAAVWYRERNSVLWRLDDMAVPREESGVAEAACNLTVKASGDGWPVPGPIALKFEAHATRLVDVAVAIARVSGGAPVHVVDSPSSHVVKSGKCVYVYENAPRVEEEHDDAHSSATSEASWAAADDQGQQSAQ
ncbi:hypothetical protein GGI15_002713 [Coemansia interrupta]|uniref:MHD domain-containing protein n=1 Tax=Coemansia interrupta TaxID=1126814 RepID=A0A9W8LJX3_9FUNG|nr:hypothetical protein GGI15_002713 [Coemansia interrupta]